MLTVNICLTSYPNDSKKHENTVQKIDLVDFMAKTLSACAAIRPIGALQVPVLRPDAHTGR